MLKKLLLVLIFTFIVSGFVYAKDIPVQIEPSSKISTSNNRLQEGDSINFVVVNDVYVNSELYVKKGTDVVGIITSLVNNDFTCQEASIYAENFRVKTTGGDVVKLRGIVYKKGRDHFLFTQYIPICIPFFPFPNIFPFIKGGEAKILPKKDVFNLYLGVNDDL